MSNTFMNALEEQYNYKFTENGALSFRSTGSKVYDLFAFGGAYRSRSDADCMNLFRNAFKEDPDLAVKCLFYLRDCRGGQGERRFFRVCYKWLAKNEPAAAIKNLKYIPFYGRWDDLLCLISTPIEKEVASLIEKQLTLDMEDTINGKAISLLAKWLPSENAHSRETKEKARWIITNLRLTPRAYRKTLSRLREQIKVLEKLMSANRWDEIEFSKIPSKAGLIYRNAFARRDIIAEKYKDFAMDKNTKVNADTLYPYEIVEKVSKQLDLWSGNFRGTEIEREMLNKYWENQKDYLDGASPSMICVIDTSGSMYGRPLDVACSLGLYCAERMSGEFAGKYISFSRRPRLVNCEGYDFVDKVCRIYKDNLCENTDLTKVFDLLLNTALQKRVKREDIPKTICVITDMEIDYMSNWRESTTKTEMERVREKWTHYGLELPRLVYWNVNARNDTILDKGPNVSFVSGCSPIIFEQVLTGKQGFDLMLEVLLKDRYRKIVA